MATCEMCGAEAEKRKFPNVTLCPDCKMFFFHGVNNRMEPDQRDNRRNNGGHVEETRPDWHKYVYGGTRK